jgi:outer membrane protein OmpA-like peptidoglycan-associated protein
MSESDTTQGQTEALSQAQKDLNKLRDIINRQALADQKQQRKDESRELVSDVITEALNDRQAKDNSISKIMVPIVEKSVQHSINRNKKEFVDHLYPLVGNLVRKFATAFVRDFIEKTNELIENSLSLKSLSWRYRAWRSGVSFSQYVASQTYSFKVEQILLIHKETGLLLNSVTHENIAADNSQLISAMLTAINDFVNDSFQTANLAESYEQNLDEIKTEDYTLYLRRGPQAFLVAAVSGNISPPAKDKLQTTLEYIHSLYLPELRSFDGDDTPFLATTDDLKECLLFEEIEQQKTKRPWLAIIIFTAIFAVFAYWLFLRFETHQTWQRLNALPNDSGIVLASADVTGIYSIDAKVFRDPDAISIDEWLANHNIQREWLEVEQIAFLSLDEPVIFSKLNKLLSRYPELQFIDETNRVEGILSSAQVIAFNQAKQQIPGIDKLSTEFAITVSNNKQANYDAIAQAMTIIAGEITRLQIDFDLASAEINASERNKVSLIASKLQLLKTYANANKLDVKLLILGTSDALGAIDINQRLSIERAQNVAQALVSLGIESDSVMTSGLGMIEDAPAGTNIRKAIVNVVYNPI